MFGSILLRVLSTSTLFLDVLFNTYLACELVYLWARERPWREKSITLLALYVPDTSQPDLFGSAGAWLERKPSRTEVCDITVPIVTIALFSISLFQLPYNVTQGEQNLKNLASRACWVTLQCKRQKCNRQIARQKYSPALIFCGDIAGVFGQIWVR